MKQVVSIFCLTAASLVVVCGAARADDSMAVSGSSAVTSGSSSDQSAGKTAAMLPEVKVKDLKKNPEKFADQDVMVKGKVNRLEGANAFILESKGLFSDKMLVVVTKPQQAGVKVPVIKEKQDLQLTGKVEDIDVMKVEEKYGPVKTEVKEEFVGVMPVLVVSPSGIKAAS